MELWFTLGVIAVAALLTFGCILVRIGSKKKEKDQDGLTLIISGWVIIVLTVLGGIAGFIIYVDLSGGLFGTLLFAVIAPIFILGGCITVLGFGISSLVEGYRRNKEGKRDRNQIIKGWFMLALSIAIIMTVVVTLTVLFHNHGGVSIGAM